jgi:predicted nuclease with TOPRIM domain
MKRLKTFEMFGDDDVITDKNVVVKPTDNILQHIKSLYDLKKEYKESPKQFLNHKIYDKFILIYNELKTHPEFNNHKDEIETLKSDIEKLNIFNNTFTIPKPIIKK